MSDLKTIKAYSRKEAIKIIKEHRVGKALYFSVSGAVRVEIKEDHYYEDAGNIKVSFVEAIKVLKNKYGLFSLIDRINEKKPEEKPYIRIQVSDYCIFIG